jgi:AAA ATPase domain
MLSQFKLSHLLWRPQPLTPLPEYTSNPPMRRTGVAGQRSGHHPAFPQEDSAPHPGGSGEHGHILGFFASTPAYAMYRLFWGICQTPPGQPSGLLPEQSMEQGAPANPRNAPQSSVQGEEMRPMLDDTRVSDRMPRGIFVGRQREMATLRASLEEALAGRGGLVMLVGEPGIGKTRTAQQLAMQAAQRGAQVLWGRCEEEAGAPPFWPWVQALRAFVQAHDTATLCAEMGASAANIADIIPEVRERCSDLLPPPRIEDPAQARFRLFDAIRSFLHQAARRHPVVLILDNLHWADTPSLRLLAFLAPELESGQVLVVGSYRDGELSRQHPLSNTLGELTRQPRFQRLRLHGLSHEDVGRFLEGVVGRAPAPELVAALHGQTEGNPLFLTEIVRFLVQEGVLTPESASLPTPAGQSAGTLLKIRIP